MKSFDFPKFRNYLVLSIAIGILFNFLIDNSTLLHYLINALFLGGMSIVITGMFLYVRVLGFFDLVFYSHRKLFQYSRFSKEEPEEDKEDLGSFHDYKLKHKKTLDYLEPLLAGGIVTALSIVLSLVYWY